MDWLISSFNYIIDMFDFVDIAVICIILTIAIIYYFNLRSPLPKFNNTTTLTNTLSNGTLTSSKMDKSFLNRMKTENRQILILYGSQTGTAEELAGRLAKDFGRFGKKPLLIDPEEIEAEDLPKITEEFEDPILLLFVATYGEGDPTDNAQALHEYFTNNEPDLTKLKYAVFGLGNKTYEHYNEVGKFFDKRLEELGAERIYELGLADDDGNLEEDFMRWREHFLSAVSSRFGWDLVNNGSLDRQYKLEIITETNGPIFKGEFGRLGAFEKQRPPFDQKNPFLSTISISRELHTTLSERSCKHIEFDIDSTKLRYDAGDHVAIFPTNEVELVEKIGELLDVNLDTVFKLINLDEESTKKHPFPCPCTYRTALTSYVDIRSPVKSHVLKALAEFCENNETKERLILLSTASEEGLALYADYILKERRNIVDILDYFKDCKPPLDLLLEMLPRLQARYYSISSSPKHLNNKIAITAIILNYQISQRQIKGVCTNYLNLLNEGSYVPIFIRKSTLRLPNKILTSVIMIGPGTGFAPFRGFLHERLWQKKQGKEIGEMHLYFGCRHSEHDHIYKEEMEEFVKLGVLTELNVAYSRQQTEKVYVQHKLWDNRERIWSLIKEGAAVYVCGDARNMARDVQNTLYKIFEQIGGLSIEEGQKLMKEMERKRLYQADVWS
ncbi:NADPH--cytochrome P450 reductase [Meloidogyne graminicola]|uniref:NADPH--cytochrome P450 reductase n=1 Tax=Meloidogyne graminicola TaxID=189291 RepID=A0A8T0A2K8_9BILA|nr:NADPH--cytochrome P450 reductase [Meloidogyne graminicola]